MTGLEVPGLLVLEVHEHRDPARHRDRLAQDGCRAQLLNRGDHTKERIVGGIAEHHARTAAHHPGEQAAAEGSGVALEVSRLEAVHHPVVEPAVTPHLDQDAAIGAGARDGHPQDRGEHRRRLAHTAQDGVERFDDLGGLLILGVGHEVSGGAVGHTTASARRIQGPGAFHHLPPVGAGLNMSWRTRPPGRPAQQPKSSAISWSPPYPRPGSDPTAPGRGQ